MKSYGGVSIMGFGCFEVKAAGQIFVSQRVSRAGASLRRVALPTVGGLVSQMTVSV